MKNKYATIEADVVIKGERKKFSFSAEPKFNFNEFIVTEIATGRKTVAVSGDLVSNIRRLLQHLRSQGIVFNITECVSKWHNWSDGSGTDFSFDTGKTDDYLKPLFKHEIAKVVK